MNWDSYLNYQAIKLSVPSSTSTVSDDEEKFSLWAGFCSHFLEREMPYVTNWNQFTSVTNGCLEEQRLKKNNAGGLAIGRGHVSSWKLDIRKADGRSGPSQDASKNVTQQKIFFFFEEEYHSHCLELLAHSANKKGQFVVGFIIF